MKKDKKIGNRELNQIFRQLNGMQIILDKNFESDLKIKIEGDKEKVSHIGASFPFINENPNEIKEIIENDNFDCMIPGSSLEAMKKETLQKLLENGKVIVHGGNVDFILENIDFVIEHIKNINLLPIEVIPEERYKDLSEKYPNNFFLKIAQVENGEEILILLNEACKKIEEDKDLSDDEKEFNLSLISELIPKKPEKLKLVIESILKLSELGETIDLVFRDGYYLDNELIIKNLMWFLIQSTNDYSELLKKVTKEYKNLEDFFLSALIEKDDNENLDLKTKMLKSRLTTEELISEDIESVAKEIIESGNEEEIVQLIPLSIAFLNDENKHVFINLIKETLTKENQKELEKQIEENKKETKE